GGAWRQVDERLGTFDREWPGVAGDVPIELVEIIEEADLPGRAIDDQVGVPAALDDDVGGAYAHALAIRDAFDNVGFGSSVALDLLDIESHADAVSHAVSVVGRDVAEDAALDVVVLRNN